jgi:hypothetical protein
MHPSLGTYGLITRIASSGAAAGTIKNKGEKLYPYYYATKRDEILPS